MSTTRVWGLVLAGWLTGCGAAAAGGGVTESASEAAAASEPASEAVSASAAESESVSEPEAAPVEVVSAVPPAEGFEEPACDPSAAPADPRDALMTPGNVHRYLVLEAWHSSLRGPPYLVEERVREARRVGGLEVARVEVRALECLGTADECRMRPFEERDFIRLRDGAETLRADGDVLPATEAEARELRRTSGTRETPAARGRAIPLCTGVGCGSVRRAGSELDGIEAWWLPGVGAALSSESWYSEETGDGGARTRVLMGWALGTPTPSTAAGPEPASFADARATFARVAAAGDLDALRALSSEHVQYSLNPEHRYVDEALAAWGDDEGLALRVLASLMAGPCGALGDVVVCPPEAALGASSACARDAAVTAPRALFERRRGRWILRALLAGGVDDLYARPEWASGAERPYGQRARFDR